MGTPASFKSSHGPVIQLQTADSLKDMTLKIHSSQCLNTNQWLKVMILWRRMLILRIQMPPNTIFKTIHLNPLKSIGRSLFHITDKFHNSSCSRKPKEGAWSDPQHPTEEFLMVVFMNSCNKSHKHPSNILSELWGSSIISHTGQNTTRKREVESPLKETSVFLLETLS